jgi:hypothetical protein
VVFSGSGVSGGVCFEEGGPWGARVLHAQPLETAFSGAGGLCCFLLLGFCVFF